MWSHQNQGKPMWLKLQRPGSNKVIVNFNHVVRFREETEGELSGCTAILTVDGSCFHVTETPAKIIDMLPVTVG